MAVYLISCGESGPVKIGKSKDPQRRLASLQSAHHEELRLLAVAVTDDDDAHEAKLHRRFAEHRIRGEWFARTPELMEVVEECRERLAPPGTFAWMRAVLPPLARLAEDAEAEAARAERQPTVCREWLFSRRFAPRLDRLVGWGGRLAPGPLLTRAAYDEAERGLRELLPACRGCLCES